MPLCLLIDAVATRENDPTRNKKENRRVPIQCVLRISFAGSRNADRSRCSSRRFTGSEYGLLLLEVCAHSGLQAHIIRLFNNDEGRPRTDCTFASFSARPVNHIRGVLRYDAYTAPATVCETVNHKFSDRVHRTLYDKQIQNHIIHRSNGPVAAKNHIISHDNLQLVLSF